MGISQTSKHITSTRCASLAESGHTCADGPILNPVAHPCCATAADPTAACHRHSAPHCHALTSLHCLLQATCRCGKQLRPLSQRGLMCSAPSADQATWLPGSVITVHGGPNNQEDVRRPCLPAAIMLAQQTPAPVELRGCCSLGTTCKHTGAVWQHHQRTTVSAGTHTSARRLTTTARQGRL